MNNNFFSFLGIAKKSGNIVEGYNKCEDMIKRCGLNLIILSKECSDNTKKKFKNYCIRYDIPLIQDIPNEKMNSCLGSLKLNVLGVIDKKISEKLISLHEEQ